ncbi:hypothetical protein AFE_1262 [Acidithiobacillus ferrooxidans ATCC 23270]|uniref:Uncharacterized protein n=1 Tax=Acidithiobacillus ferrooxidans (strain ATCC 23270 / DSM 14882 / CIP 104768 / NCIMB 8455) TaxID=243159 RepID=B7J8U4_ACIF2|nr:hypothetical protein AFE_1262 [Acidithiobacillus ferrooxidans ATCC 23270]
MAALAELPTVALPFRLVQKEAITHAAYFPSIAQPGLIANPTKFCMKWATIRANQTNQTLHETAQIS